MFVRFVLEPFAFVAIAFVVFVINGHVPYILSGVHQVTKPDLFRSLNGLLDATSILLILSAVLMLFSKRFLILYFTELIALTVILVLSILVLNIDTMDMWPYIEKQRITFNVLAVAIVGAFTVRELRLRDKGRQKES